MWGLQWFVNVKSVHFFRISTSASQDQLHAQWVWRFLRCRRVVASIDVKTQAMNTDMLTGHDGLFGFVNKSPLESAAHLRRR